MLVQHIFELFFGSALKSNELDPELIALLPTADGKGNDDQRPSTGRLYLEAQMGSDGKLDMTFDFTSGNREIGYPSMA